MSLANKATAVLGTVLVSACLVLGVGAYWQHSRIVKLEATNVVVSSDIAALKKKTAALEAVRKEQGAKNAKYQAATAANPAWADELVPDAVADSLRKVRDAGAKPAR